VGIANAAIDLGIFNVLIFAAPTRNPGRLTLYNTAAVIVAMANGYLWHSRWTFRDRAARGPRELWKQRGAFGLQAGVNIGVNDVAVAILGTLFNLGHVIPATIANEAAKLLAMLAASTTSYYLMKLIVFRPATGRSDRVPGAARWRAWWRGAKRLLGRARRRASASPPAATGELGPDPAPEPLWAPAPDQRVPTPDQPVRRVDRR
jgi:putative flippase GtrA